MPSASSSSTISPYVRLCHTSSSSSLLNYTNSRTCSPARLSFLHYKEHAHVTPSSTLSLHHLLNASTALLSTSNPATVVPRLTTSSNDVVQKLITKNLRNLQLPIISTITKPSLSAANSTNDSTTTSTETHRRRGNISVHNGTPTYSMQYEIYKCKRQWPACSNCLYLGASWSFSRRSTALSVSVSSSKGATANTSTFNPPCRRD